MKSIAERVLEAADELDAISFTDPDRVAKVFSVVPTLRAIASDAEVPGDVGELVATLRAWDAYELNGPVPRKIETGEASSTIEAQAAEIKRLKDGWDYSSIVMADIQESLGKVSIRAEAAEARVAELEEANKALGIADAHHFDEYAELQAENAALRSRCETLAVNFDGDCLLCDGVRDHHDPSCVISTPSDRGAKILAVVEAARGVDRTYGTISGHDLLMKMRRTLSSLDGDKK